MVSIHIKRLYEVYVMDNLINPTLIDDMFEDYTIYKLNHLVWINKHELWKKWLRVV